MEENRLYSVYGNFNLVPHIWYKLCGRYHISEEIAKLPTKNNTVEINAAEINVLAYIASYEVCYASNSQLASLFNVEIKTIEKYIRKLRLVGFVKSYDQKFDDRSRRHMYVQFNVINDILNPLRTKGQNTERTEKTVKSDPIKEGEISLCTLPFSPTDIPISPHVRMTNNKEKEKKEREKERNVADAPISLIDPHLTQPEMLVTNISPKRKDLSSFKSITKNQIAVLDFNISSIGKPRSWYVIRILHKYLECCDQKKNATDTIKDILTYMSEFDCNLKAVETCVDYLLYQHRVLQRDLQDITNDCISC